jgi:hypothetical protein
MPTRKRGEDMEGRSYTASFRVDQTPKEVFSAINNVRGWWSGEIEGDTDRLGAVFTYRVPEVHYCRMKITELVPGKRVVWHVLESDISYTKVRNEWDDTKITFDISRKDGKTEVRFTHLGLVPAYECYDACSDAWGTLIRGSLRKLITTGKVQPTLWATRA